MATNNALNNRSTNGFSVTGGVLSLPTTTSTTGQLTINSARFLHSYGTSNTWLGSNAGNFTLTGSLNVGIGDSCCVSITSGTANVGVGHLSLNDETTGTGNTAIGWKAMENSVGASTNTVIGHTAGFNYSTGSDNVAIGNGAHGAGIVTGVNNVAIGYQSMYVATSAQNNIAIGQEALDGLTTGLYNICLGLRAGQNYTTSESSNILLNSFTTHSTGESNALRIGNGTGAGDLNLNKAFIHGIRGITTANADAIPVYIDSAGQLGTGGGSIVSSVTLTSTTPYDVTSTDYFVGIDCSAAIKTVRLPDAPLTGRIIVVKDYTGSAASFNITLTTVGGAVNIDGATSYVINTAYQSVTVVFNGVSYSII